MATDRTVPAALALLALVGMTALAVGTGGVAGLGSGAAPAAPASAPAAAVAGPGAAASASATGQVAPGAGFTECTNGTSRSMLACGYQPGPTAVELAPQETTGDAVRIRAVDLAEGGFVVVHRESFVDGNVVGSAVGTSSYLDAGLHTDVRVPLDRSFSGTRTLVAVVYRDDGDERFEFVSADGGTDRPYTNTYSPSAGNVTDEAGDVIGDTARVTAVESMGPPPVVGDAAPTDPDDDGIYEDIDGDGTFDVFDVQALLETFESAPVQDNPGSFDLNGDGGVDIFDVQALLEQV